MPNLASDVDWQEVFMLNTYIFASSLSHAWPCQQPNVQAWYAVHMQAYNWIKSAHANPNCPVHSAVL